MNPQNSQPKISVVLFDEISDAIKKDDADILIVMPANCTETELNDAKANANAKFKELTEVASYPPVIIPKKKRPRIGGIR